MEGNLGQGRLVVLGLYFPTLAPLGKSETSRKVIVTSDIHRLCEQTRSSGRWETGGMKRKEKAAASRRTGRVNTSPFFALTIHLEQDCPAPIQRPSNANGLVTCERTVQLWLVFLFPPVSRPSLPGSSVTRLVQTHAGCKLSAYASQLLQN